MKFRITIVAIVATATIAGCATSQPSKIQAIKSDHIKSVVDDMKRQASVYVAYQNSKQGTRSVIDATGTKPCGNGLIDFDIKSVKLEILTTLETSANAGVDIGPIATGNASLTGGIGGGRMLSNTQELGLSANMLPDPKFTYAGRSQSVDTAPIAATLINLRNGLIEAGEVNNRVCFKTKPEDNTYKVAVSIVDSVNGKIGLGLAPMALTASGETKSTTGNTLTVAFAPHVFTKAEVANVRKLGSRGATPDVSQANVWNAPVPGSLLRTDGSGHDCPSGSTDPKCQGVYRETNPKM